LLSLSEFTNTKPELKQTINWIVSLAVRIDKSTGSLEGAKS
tara:strand:+ start:955 stop:1077 length:123 start_codon:yes stop_codon:yes gene_type:complete